MSPNLGAFPRWSEHSAGLSANHGTMLSLLPDGSWRRVWDWGRQDTNGIHALLVTLTLYGMMKGTDRWNCVCTRCTYRVGPGGKTALSLLDSTRVWLKTSIFMLTLLGKVSHGA